MSHARVPFHRTPFRRRRPAIPFSEVFVCVRGFSGSALVRIRFWQRHIVISILSDSNLQKRAPFVLVLELYLGLRYVQQGYYIQQVYERRLETTDELHRRNKNFAFMTKVLLGILLENEKFCLENEKYIKQP